MNVPVEGQVLAGKYRVERVLGKGGMGVVVAATHLQLGQRVAIKLLLEGATQEIISRFIREARAAVRLRSEHTARVLDVGDLPDGAPFMVMEYLEGNDLAHLLKSQGALPVADAVLYVLHACEAMAEAHSIGIIHRDLKPANLFLTRGADGSLTIKVLDFGISKTLDEQDEVELTRTTALLGSPIYMSPEQLRSAREVTAQSDIWSLGAILYQLLAGVVPFNTKTFSELIMMVNMQEPPPLTKLREGIPERLEAAALRCLEKKPEARFANVGELAWAIADYGPPEARASAEKSLRTLEAAGIRVQRTTEVSGMHRAPSSPALTQHRSVPPLSPATLSGASTLVMSSPRPRRQLVMVGVTAAVVIAATAVGLTLRGASRSPEHSLPTAVDTTARASSATGGTPPSAPTITTAAVLPGASGAPEPSVTVSAPPASASGTTALPRSTTGTLPASHPTSRPAAPTATPAASAPTPGTLKVKIKD